LMNEAQKAMAAMTTSDSRNENVMGGLLKSSVYDGGEDMVYVRRISSSTSLGSEKPWE